MTTQLLQFSGGSPRWKIIFLTTLLLGLFLVFWLPTRVPTPLAASDSYLFGFNNRVCVFLFVALVVATFAIARLGGLVWPAPERDAPLPQPDLTPKPLVVSLSIAAVLCAFMFWVTHNLGGINDGAYFQDRTQLILRGLVPTRDFEFLYGTGPLYAVAALTHLHLSVDTGYLLLWTAATLLGIYLLWLSIRWIDLPIGGKRPVFLLFSALLILLIPGVALNYTGLRYSLPVFAIAGLCRLDRDGRLATRIQVVAFTTAMAAVLLSYSPEEGLVFGIAACLYLPLRRFYANRAFLPDMLALLLATAGLCVLAANFGIFATMKRFGAGAFNLPVYPGPHILFGMAAALLTVCYLGSGHLADRARSNVTLAAIYGTGMLAGALGRCDTIHIAGYLMAFLICALLLCWSWPRIWRLAAPGFLLIFLVLPFLIGQVTMPPTLSKVFLNHLYHGGVPSGPLGSAVDRAATYLAQRLLGSQKGMAKMAALRSSSAASSLDPHDIFPGASATIGAPFEYLPNKLSIYQGPDIDEGYFLGSLNILTPAEVQHKTAELRDHPGNDLVLSTEQLQQCQVQVGSRAAMRALLELPWVPNPRREGTMLQPFCDYLQHHYAFLYPPSPATFGYGLMRRLPQ